jgi:ABC-type lipoprotein release transport system permease subunit/ABC-type multidrug transport system fused ATPase/permease subunit
MNLSLILKRARREWRQLAVLIVALCLVTAFFALGPLYVRAMVQSGLQYAFATGNAHDMALTLVSETAFRPDSWQLVNEQLGALNAGLVRIARSAAAFGGYSFTYGEPTTQATPRSAIGYRVYAISNLRDVLELVDGRWPNRLPSPDSPERQASTPEEQIARGVGNYSRGDVEALITPEVARRTGYQLGTRFVIGERPANRVVVNVVGIVEAANPADPIWIDNEFALTGEVVQGGIGRQSYNAAFFVTEGAYSDWIAKASTRAQGGANNSYTWRIKLNSEAINADNVADVQSRLTTLVNRLTADYPGLLNFNPLLKLLNNYRDSVANTEGSVVLLSGAILVLMLYHLVTTVGLVLEQQMGEWTSMSSRGASARQLVTLQGLTMILLGVVGFGVGPFLAVLVLRAITCIGPLAQASGSTAPVSAIPASAFQLSAIAAVTSVLALTLPAIPAARRGLTQFKQIAARPPVNPAWARIRLDLILIVVGLGFIARLLFFVSGDLGETLSGLAGEPRRLIQVILDSANRAGGLADPLNLIGPALVLTGAALLWLRLFPALTGLMGRIVARGDSLTGPLAVWNVERDPNHYAQLVLLLIGTLALGTAALALGTTRDTGTWAVARLATGGAARIDFDPRAGEPVQTDWLKLPGVSAYTTLTRFASEYKTGRFQVFIAGVDPADMAKQFPETAEAVSPLIGQGFDRLAVPVVMSVRMAEDEGRATRTDRLPLEVGAKGQVEILLPGDKTTLLHYRIVGIARSFPSLSASQHFLIMDAAAVPQIINAEVAEPDQVAPNEVWLEIPDRQPAPTLDATILKIPGVTDAAFAWEPYNQLLREPLPAAIAGMLYAGFWVSLLLSLLDFGFYLAVTARRRSLGFAVLRALGWNANHLWVLLVVEQTALVIPALLVGVALGAALAYVILPFLALVGGETLKLPVLGLIGLLVALVVGFGILLLGTALRLRKLNVNQVLRSGEE